MPMRVVVILIASLSVHASPPSDHDACPMVRAGEEVQDASSYLQKEANVQKKLPKLVALQGSKHVEPASKPSVSGENVEKAAKQDSSQQAGTLQNKVVSVSGHHGSGHHGSGHHGSERHGSGHNASKTDTIEITREAGEPVVLNVTDKAPDIDNSDQHVLKDITRNTTNVSVEHKVVGSKGGGKRKVVHTHAEDSSDKTPAETDYDAKIKGRREKGKGGKPFTDVNITVHRHFLNITRRVNSTRNETQNVTITETVKSLDVASPFYIASIYIVLFVPVLLGWLTYIHFGYRESHYMLVLPLTMCTMSIGQDLVNQSLTVLLEAPNIITAIQAGSMAIMTLVISLREWSTIRMIPVAKLTKWLGVAALFALYQVMNHWVYYSCSLSERTVFTNLSPLITLALERLVMPATQKPSISIGAKLALSLMVIGSVLFSIQNPDFTLDGIAVAGLLLLTTVPYRLAQRHLLADGPELHLAALACIDGLMLALSSALLSLFRNVHWNLLWNLEVSALETSVVFMLALSVFTFAGLHISGLAMLRVGSATTFLVYSNIASLVTVALGIFFFGDNAVGTSLAWLGLAANVGSGIWYSSEVQWQKTADAEKENAEKLDHAAARTAAMAKSPRNPTSPRNPMTPRNLTLTARSPLEVPELPRTTSFARTVTQ